MTTSGDGSPIVSGVNGNVNIVNGDGNTVTNNNAIAHLTFSLCLFLLLEALFSQASTAASLLAGVALGGHGRTWARRG